MIQAKVEINFHEQDKASVFYESNNSGFDEINGQLLLFSFFLTRQMVNVGELALSLAAMISTLEKGGVFSLFIIKNDKNPNGASLVDYPGHKGRKAFIALLNYENPSNVSFQLEMRGFPGGEGYYVPNSIMAFLKYLITKNESNLEFLQAIYNVLIEWGKRTTMGLIDVENHNSVALELAVKNFLGNKALNPNVEDKNLKRASSSKSGCVLLFLLISLLLIGLFAICSVIF